MPNTSVWTESLAVVYVYILCARAKEAPKADNVLLHLVCMAEKLRTPTNSQSSGRRTIFSTGAVAGVDFRATTKKTRNAIFHMTADRCADRFARGFLAVLHSREQQGRTNCGRSLCSLGVTSNLHPIWAPKAPLALRDHSKSNPLKDFGVAVS